MSETFNSNINEIKITIFPWSKVTGTASLLYEQNIANIIRQLTDVDSFVISGDIKNFAVTDDAPLKLNIYGYYIEIPSGTNLKNFMSSSDGDDIYINLHLTNTNDDVPQEINGQLLSEAITFTSSPDKSTGTHTLQLTSGQLTSEQFPSQIPPYSRKKFNTTSLGVMYIDGSHNLGEL